MGQLDNTVLVFTTDNGAEMISFPDGGVTPFKGPEGRVLGRWLPLTAGRPLARPHQAGHGEKPADGRSRLGADAGRHCRRGKGDELKKKIEAGQYPGIVKTTLDGSDQRDYLEGKSEARVGKRRTVQGRAVR